MLSRSNDAESFHLERALRETASHKESTPRPTGDVAFLDGPR
jgi:hypothetical protein